MQTIWLEFRHENGAVAANGTDVTFHIDGRWSANTTKEKIYERVEELRRVYSKYSKQHFIGYTHSQMPFYDGKGGAIHRMIDRNPPQWHLDRTVNVAVQTFNN